MDSYPNTFNFKANPAVGGAMLAFISPDIPQQEMVATFESYLRTVIFPTACKGRHVVLDIECTTMKSLTISISIDGSHPYTRTAPTFGSSSWNPVSATTLEANTSMSNGMLDLTSYMVNSQQGNAQPGTSYVETTQQGTSDPLDNDLF